MDQAWQIVAAGAVLLTGFLLPIITMTTAAVKNEKYKNDEFVTKIWLPAIIGTVLFGLAFIALFWNVYDEKIWALMIGYTAILGIGLGLSGTYQAMIRMRYASP